MQVTAHDDENVYSSFLWESRSLEPNALAFRSSCTLLMQVKDEHKDPLTNPWTFKGDLGSSDIGMYKERYVSVHILDSPLILSVGISGQKEAGRT